MSGLGFRGAINLGINNGAEIALEIEVRGKENDSSVDYAKLVSNLRKIIDDIVNE